MKEFLEKGADYQLGIMVSKGRRKIGVLVNNYHTPYFFANTIKSLSKFQLLIVR